jgi:hypothetical protein
MPWLLDTPIDSGDLDDGEYSEVKITRFVQDSNRGQVNLRLEYGNTVDGKWESGYLPKSKSPHATINDRGDTDYSTLVADAVPDVQTSDPGDPIRYVPAGDVWVERTYYAVKRGLYAYLEDKGIIDAGTMS